MHGRSLRTACAAAPLVVVAPLPALAVVAATQQAWRAALAPGPALPEDAVAAAAGTVAVALAGWLLLAVVTSVAAAVLPSGQRPTGTAARLATATAPLPVRRTIAALLGATVVGIAAPAAGAAAGAAGPPVAAAASVAAPAADLDPGWSPSRASTPASTSGLSHARRQVDLPAAAARRTANADDEIVVRRGDTLWAVAARYLGSAVTAAEVAAAWPRWYAANRAVIGRDPDHIEPGMRLHPPRDTAGSRT
jgi:nucleoid-associated protein YgaU